MLKEIYATFMINPDQEVITKSADEAVKQILDQLSPKMEDAVLFSDEFVFGGKEVCIPAHLLNPVMRALEAMGRWQEVWVCPALFGCQKPTYILKPIIWNPEYAVQVGIRVTSDMDEEDFSER